VTTYRNSKAFFIYFIVSVRKTNKQTNRLNISAHNIAIKT
jgi:hypothetical protein